MKILGYVVVTIGFLTGALVSVLDELQVQWGYLLACLAAGIVGIILIRLSMHREAREEGTLTLNIQNIEASLGRIADNAAQLDADKENLDPYEVRMRIDALFPDDLGTFVEARKSIAHVHGLQAYADVMSSFAAGERYLNRVWSASADGYIDEVREYLGRAREQFQLAQAEMGNLTSKEN